MTSLAEKIVREHAAIAADLPGSVVSLQRRREALSELVARGLPNNRDEDWRYANLRPLDRATFSPSATLPGAAAPEELPPPLPGFARLLVLDGVLQDPGAARTILAPSLAVTSLRTPSEALPLLRASPESTGDAGDGGFALLNEAFALDGLVLTTSAAAPGHVPAVELLFVSSGRAAAYPRVRIELAAGTKLRLLERHVGGAAAPVTNAFTEIGIGRDATLDHVRIQSHSIEASWIDTLDAVLGAGASYALQHYGVGGRSARSSIRVRLAAPQASIALHCAMIADGLQTADTHARIEHAAPRTRSTQNFRGIGAGRSRVAFTSHVLVQHGAHGADSKQSLRTLIAGQEAEVDARPQLEIYTDDVKCSHGATAGKLDEAMLFYMLSRGLEHETARSLLKWAFLEDTVAHLADGALRGAVEQVLAAHLRDATVAEGRSS